MDKDLIRTNKSLKILFSNKRELLCDEIKKMKEDLRLQSKKKKK